MTSFCFLKVYWWEFARKPDKKQKTIFCCDNQVSHIFEACIQRIGDIYFAEIYSTEMLFP